MRDIPFFVISQSDQQWCSQNDVNITYPGRHDYPQAFLDLPCRPGVLFYMGQPVWQTHKLLAVVGSRSPQPASLKWLDEHLGAFIHRHDFAVVSGGARGVDQKAHQVALRAEKPTVVFLPSGLRHIYPHQLQDWVGPILDVGGCIISQFLPSAPMYKKYFRERNYLIAALPSAVVLVECGRRSGTMLTAQKAVVLERRVGVMPTFPGESGMGGLDLICDSGAFPLRDATDFELIFLESAKLHHAKEKENKICHPGSEEHGDFP